MKEAPMKISEPKLDDRAAQPYAGIRTKVHMSEMGGDLVPRLLGEVFDWLGAQGVAPAGAPFMRFHVIDMAASMDIELGVPVAAPVSGNGRIKPGVLPAGRYASLVYTGIANGIDANRALIEWANANGIAWDRWDDPDGDAFASRYESFLTDPADEPDPADWETEVAIKLADPAAQRQ
jgi:effector-binding domain-containing protein